MFSSDKHVAYYFETLTKMPLQELVVGLEGFCISGIQGMSRFFNLISGSHAQCFLPGITCNYRMQLGEWKKKVKEFSSRQYKSHHHVPEGVQI